MTPLIPGVEGLRIAELESAKATTVEQRLERLSLAFEAAKPYLLSTRMLAR